MLQQIGPYRVLRKLGVGGWGEVYLAEDSRLGRKVALKVLRENLAVDETLKRRFLKEARAASALNHPHIVTLYDITSADHSDVIAMEYVEGESLRAMLSRGPIEIKRAVEIAAQVASALAAAHHAGIVHRDIKPENIIVSRTNHAKVCDFGLAKLMEKTAESGTASELITAAPLAVSETETGMIVGTVAYMSPEQAEGQSLDHRTDIFSLGVVLYEMCTGVRPFGGKSAVDTLHAIMHQEQQSVLQLKPDLPAEVVEILAKALVKNPNERYQHAGDFELDLRRFKRALESNSLISRQVQTTQRPRKGSILYWFVATLVIAAAALVSWKFGQPPSKAVAPVPLIERASLTPLTVDAGFEGYPTFSPDGETIAYVSDRTGNFEIFLKQVSGGPDINLTNNVADDVQPSFSPDGKQIAFVSIRSSKSDLYYPTRDSPLVGGDIWVMPALGGSAKRIVESGNFPSWSPDGSHILYASGPKLFRVTASGGDPREIPVHSKVRVYRLLFPSYSPSGRWILFATFDKIFLLNAQGGEPQVILKGFSPAWTDSGKIIYSSGESGKNFSLWQAPFADKEGKIIGPPEPLTFGPSRSIQPAVSKNRNRIVFTSVNLTFNVEIMPFDAELSGVTGKAQPLTKGSDVIYFVNFSPDARSVVFDSQRGATSHIWRFDLGAVPIQLTSDPKFDETYPRYSPDGRTIAFCRKESKNLEANNTLWLMAADGADPQPLPIQLDRYFAWASNGDSLVYFSALDSQLYSYELSSKVTRRLTNESGVSPVVAASLDGKWLMYQSTFAGNTDIRAVRSEGGPSRVVVATPHLDYHPFASPSGRWLYFQFEHKNLYRVPGPAQDWRQQTPEKITNFPESGLFIEDPQISRDGKQLLYTHGRFTGDIWMLELSDVLR